MRQTLDIKNQFNLILTFFNAMEIMPYAISIYIPTKKTYQHIDDFITVTGVHLPLP